MIYDKMVAELIEEKLDDYFLDTLLSIENYYRVMNIFLEEIVYYSPIKFISNLEEFVRQIINYTEGRPV